jgi:hypothetical protein
VFLADREKKILMVVIPLQVMAEVAIIVLDEDTPAARNWFTWMNILHLVRGAALLEWQQDGQAPCARVNGLRWMQC